MRPALLFWRRIFRYPAKIGAVCPSSRFLANKMVSLLPEKIETLLELGAGTGAITRKLYQTDYKQLVIFEYDSQFCDHLKKHYPGAIVINDTIECLNQYRQIQHWPVVNAIVSSIPLLNFSKSVKIQILTELLAVMPVGGTLVQFTYGINNPAVDMTSDWHNAVETSAHKVWLNIPPATVWCYQKH